MLYQKKIDDYFKLLASSHPSAPAIITDELLLTYGELDALSDRLAIALQIRGSAFQESIGVLTDRSASLPAAFLAILKAGGVYVPMAADLPPERLANMAEQASIRRIVALDGLEIPPALTTVLLRNGATSPSDALLRPEALISGVKTIFTPSERNSGTNALAAILFTSGSSGTPKGVPLTHAACINMVLGHIEAHHITAEDRILLSSSPVFILGFRTLCIPLISGSAFVPVSRSVIDRPDLLIELMSRHHVSIALFTPSYLHILNRALPEGLRCIITAGEMANADDARYYARYVDYWNIHGATEVCGTICMHHVDPDETGAVLSGRPFLNTLVYLLDEEGNEVPTGEIGEVHVVGVGLSPGYLKQPELNAEYFIETRYGRAFRSRDLARWNADGELETLGRSDNVVKISGQTVSLDEIELSLQRHPSVTIAKVVPHKGRLYAFVESPGSRDAEGVVWREFLLRTLPSYMIPAHITVMEKMPLSSAGKVDQRTLQQLAEGLLVHREGDEGVSTPPDGVLEQAIACIWEEALAIRPIMREQNFFAAGGTSLLAIAVSQRLHQLGYNVPVQMVLSSLSVKALAEQIVSMEEEEASPIRQSDFPDENLATADQEDFWIASEIGLAPAASHIARLLRVQGRQYSPEEWQSAWAHLLERHTALRTALYADEKGRVRWRSVGIEELSLDRGLRIDHCRSLGEARSIAAQRVNERFRLDNPPLSRAGLIWVDEGSETLFWFVLHHALVDGASARLLQDDLLSLLGKRELPPAPDGIAMAGIAEQHYLRSAQRERDRLFWMSRFDELAERDSGAFSDYVTERQRPALPGGEGAEPLLEQLDGDTVLRLSRMAKSCGIGLHALLLAILSSEIRRRTGRSDILVGSGITIRPAGGESAIGHFVNVVPVILFNQSDIPFSEDLRNTQSALTETVEHAAYPAGMLYREFRKRHPDLRSPSRTSLFDIALTAIPSRSSSDQESGLRLEPLTLAGEMEHPAAGLDLSFSHEPSSGSEGGLNLLLSWNPDVCSIDGARSWLASFAAWARWLAEKPERLEHPLPALLPFETELLQRWEEGEIKPRPNLRSHELFEALVERNPARTAIICPNRSETFRELDARANGIADSLVSHGVVRGCTVGVLASTPENLPAAVLGIWKAGGTYLPFAADTPAARLALMAKDAAANHLVVLDALKVPDALYSEVACIIHSGECPPTLLRPESDGSADDIAYIIYTSGTTGTPKGVPVSHAAYVNAILGVAERLGLRDDDRIALVSTMVFDASLWELGHGLLNGIAMVPVPPALREDPWQMKPYYREQGVTVAFHTPSYLRVSEKLPFEGLRILLTGGEAPNHHDMAIYAGRLAFWNFYGPTEATIVVSGALIAADTDSRVPLPVGAPLANMRISIRRHDGSPVPPGAEGEIWLGGIGIARGYLNHPEESERHFVQGADGTFYRSGDYGRWSAEGQLEINGRIDQQVKLNGQRVEPGEIEQMLSLHPAVVNAVVLADQLNNGVKVLRAFVQPENIALFSESELLEYLAGRLPQHMVPASIMAVEAIPLNPSGKIDREQLFRYAKEQRRSAVQEDVPGSPIEQQIGNIWAEVLGHERVVGSDNFFALGGNSLLAVTVAHRISRTFGVQLSARALFAAPTLRAFAEKTVSLPALAGVEDLAEESEVASEGEHEFWIAHSAGLDTRNFIIPVHYLVDREITADRLRSAWAVLVRRHEGLRSFFESDESGRLRRHSARDMEWTLESEEVYSTSDALLRIREHQFSELSMSAAPLWRAGFVDVSGEKMRFFWLALHHSIGDGQSIATLFSELARLLDGAVLSPHSPGGGVFAAREQNYLASGEADDDARYWKNLLEGVPDAAFEEWPLDMARSSRSLPGSHRFELLLDRETSEALKTIARDHDATLHSLVLTLLSLEAGRRSGRSDIMIGTTASVRERESDSQIIAYGVNMLPLHLKRERMQTFGDRLHATQHDLSEALQHARLPFARIYRSFWNEHPELRNPQRYPLFDIAVTENPGGRKDGAARYFTVAGKGTAPVRYEYTGASPGQDMVLIHENLEGGEILLQWHVNAALYTAETAGMWLEAVKGWAHWLAEDPRHAARPIPELLEEELRLLEIWQQGEIVERPELCFHQLFESVTDRPGQAGRAAVISPDRLITYRELDEEACVIAAALSERGVTRGEVVAVLSGRSKHLPAALLGIWKRGAIYLPLSTELPPERMSFMAEDAGVAQLIALDGAAVPELLARLFAEPLRPEELPEAFRRQHSSRVLHPAIPEDTAYILYTSGSTGLPKGTMIAHKSLVNMVLGAAGMLGCNCDDRTLLFASPSFDVSLSDIGVPLSSGGAICAVPGKIIESPNRFLEFLEEMQVTIADITPTYLGLFEGMELPSSLRVLVTGGEAPLPAEVKRYASKLSYFNAYGPTENTITSTMGLLKGDELRFFAAGRPLPNTALYICNEAGDYLPPGVSGEIRLGGEGISQGYLNRPELTAASFLGTSSGRLYRTGDLGRWHRDGTVEIIGRIDDQVKLNGIRIELGEIEYALTMHPAISQAVVLLDAPSGGSKSLWGVVRLTPGEEMPGRDELKTFLAERLPSHMIPSGVISVESIPLMVSGKVDRVALLALLEDHPFSSGLTPPEDELERCIAGIWSDLLRRSPIHREDNFFALGGHSLLAIAVAHRLQQSLGKEVPARELFAEPTLAGFSQRVRELNGAEGADDARTDLATEGQREFWTAERAGLGTSGFNIPLALLLHGEKRSAEKWRALWNELVERHEALRTGFYEDEAGNLRRVNADKVDAALELCSASSLEEARALVISFQSAPFSMSVPGLWRAGLIEVGGSNQTVFWLVMHHAVGDGLSLGILIDELTALLFRGSAPALLKTGLDRPAAREAAYLESNAAIQDAEYWQHVMAALLKSAPEAFDEWPLDKLRPNLRAASSSPGSHCFRTRLEPAMANALRLIAKRNRSTLHAFMLCLLGLEVRRRTGRNRFMIGTAASTRHSLDEMRTVGYFINMLPLVFHAPESASTDAAVQDMQQQLAEALQHVRYPFARIYSDFRRNHELSRHPGRYPLFDIAVTENPALSQPDKTEPLFSGLALPGTGITDYELRRNAPAQDMVLVHEGEADGGLVITWYVNAALYRESSARTWFDSLTGWMRYFSQNQESTALPPPLLLPEEDELLAGWQRGVLRNWPANSLPERIAQIASLFPERTALVTKEGDESFGMINTRADFLARALFRLEVHHGECVGVLTERSVALPETVLAIWKAGACYLPLTADLPAERLLFMAREAGVRKIIALDRLAVPAELSSLEFHIVRPEEIIPDAARSEDGDRPLSPDDPAYIIFTSGSTGVPKGVVLSHRGLINLGFGEAGIFNLCSEDRVMQISSPSFDLWISDLAVAWSLGAALVPVRREEMNDISGMHELMRRRGVTIATMSPSYLRLFEQADFPAMLRLIMTVGEPPLQEDLHYYSARLAYMNGYGPSEATAASTVGLILPDADQIHAGRPLPNTTVYISGEGGKPLPPGVTGEVWVGGAGLAAGYLNRPDLTAQAFVLVNGERRYRTGDLGRWLRSGELQILGRADSQVKLRGQRVELGEIEHRLASRPGIQQAVAVVETLADSTQRLCSFVVVDEQAEMPSSREWLSWLSATLPSYMIPASIVRIAALPLTPAGKVDRQALLDLQAEMALSLDEGITDTTTLSQRTPPQSATEKRIAEVWSELLRKPLVAREESFFELGGDSLRAIAVINRLGREFECTVNNLYEHPVLSDFALLCRPRPDHLRQHLQRLCSQERNEERCKEDNDREEEDAVRLQRALYEERVRADLKRDLQPRASYRHILLTGATGYLGSYLLRELLEESGVGVTVIVRGSDSAEGRVRLERVLGWYFGRDASRSLLDNPRLHVLSGDLRHPELLLADGHYAQLSESIDAVYHCAANVNHIGHYRDFLADNVEATRHLLRLAAGRKNESADFHFVSTLSVSASALSGGLRLFSEYDPPPEVLDDNYYIRSKQEAERLVIAYRTELPNCTIHRVGNISFASEGSQLQQNIRDNAFFRQLSAFLRLGVVPAVLPASLSHVDLVARSITALAYKESLANEIHHIETSRPDSLAEVILSTGGMKERVRACSFGDFLRRLQEAVEEPEMESAVAETVENFRLQSASPALAGRQHVMVVSKRTRLLLERFGIVWPSIPKEGLNALLDMAMEVAGR
ncbi:non-ribosomal peptide synthetase [Chlorobium ferrooxidans]|uniref:Amino acid adenylation n=1 Tax=Chlorobium ferrooxidans DSM 13031 TaxID=377431 RepID=Q0YRE6_9CHLB|nr:non-ribosomal peptide synthetase [Chlorobium ferrooxidans]EAT58876.1 Amino acid adenylation [Chlorobium ferrooxidans DSM 13031]